MAQPKTPGPPVPPVVLEYLMLLAQNGSLPPFVPAPQHLPPPAMPILVEPATPMPPTQGHTFNRLSRGTGGVLLEKQRVSKQITASTKKPKSQLDPGAKIPLSPRSEAAESTGSKQTKRPKTKGGAQCTKALPKLSQRQSYATPAPTDPELIPSPILTPVSPTPIRPTSRAIKPTAKVQLPKPIDVSLVDDNDDNVFISGVQDPGSDWSGEGSDEEANVLTLTNHSDLPTPIQNQNLKFPRAPINLIQAYLSQFGGATPLTLQVQPSPTVYSTGDNTKSPKSITFYPDGWAKAFNKSRDVVRASILLTDPFPNPADARIMVSESLHKVTMTLCTDSLVLEPGLSWNNNMLSILLTDIATSRGELKKLAKIFVGADPTLFPLSEDDKSFVDQSAPEICTITARMEKKKKKKVATGSQPLYDSNHVHTSVASRLVKFTYLNDPPTTNISGELLTNPILEKLCKSFYEEEKWQRSLVYQATEDSKWVSSVTVTMVSLAATAYRGALDEWKTSHFVSKVFGGEKYSKIHAEIQEHIVDYIENDPLCKPALNCFSSWPTESLFV